MRNNPFCMQQPQLAAAFSAVLLKLHCSAALAIAQAPASSAVLQRLVATVPCDPGMPATSLVDLDQPLALAEVCAVMSTAWALVAQTPADTAVERLRAGRLFTGALLSEYSMEPGSSVTQKVWLVEFALQASGALSVTVNQLSGEVTGPFFVHAAPAYGSPEK